MHLEIITDKRKINKKSWSEFVKSHPKGNIFQSPEYYSVCEKAQTRDPIIAVAEENNNTIGIMMGVVQREDLKFFQSFTARTIVWGGPLIKMGNEHCLNRLVTAFNKIAANESIYCQIRNLWEYEDAKNYLRDVGFEFVDHLGITIDLEPNLDTLWSNMKSQGRRNIRKAKKEDVEFKVVEEKKQYRRGIEIVESLYDYLGLPLPDKAYFDALYDELLKNEYLKVFGAFYDDKLIGVLFGFCYNGLIYEWYTGSDPDYLKKRPNDLLIWHVLNYGKENGFSQFDMGGGGKPGEEYGVRDHKLKFGSKLHHFGRYLNVYKPLKYKLGKLGIKYWDSIKKILK